MSKPINETLRLLSGDTEGSNFLDDVSNAMAELVTAVDATGKGGELNIKIVLKKATRGAVSVAGKYSIKKPVTAPDVTLLFSTPEGNLLTQDPRQQNLELKTVAQAIAVPLKQVGEK